MTDEQRAREIAERFLFWVEPCDHGTADALTCQMCVEDGRNYDALRVVAALLEAISDTRKQERAKCIERVRNAPTSVLAIRAIEKGD